MNRSGVAAAALLALLGAGAASAQVSCESLKGLQLPDVKSRLTELGAEPVGSTPAQFAAHIKSEIAKWAKVIKEANVELQ